MILDKQILFQEISSAQAIRRYESYINQQPHLLTQASSLADFFLSKISMTKLDRSTARSFFSLKCTTLEELRCKVLDFSLRILLQISHQQKVTDKTFDVKTENSTDVNLLDRLKISTYTFFADGRIFHPQFQLGMLGEGAYNNVFEIYDIDAHEIRAERFLKSNWLNQKEVMEAWKREVEIHKMLQNSVSGIVRLMRIESPLEGEKKGRLILERCDSDLSSFSTQKLDEIEFENIFLQLLVTFKEILELGYTHKDLKPDNIFFTGQKNSQGVFFNIITKLGDFGFMTKIHDKVTTSGNYGYVPLDGRYFLPDEDIILLENLDAWSLGFVLLKLKMSQNTQFENYFNKEFSDRILAILYSENNVFNCLTSYLEQLQGNTLDQIKRSLETISTIEKLFAYLKFSKDMDEWSISFSEANCMYLNIKNEFLMMVQACVNTTKTCNEFMQAGEKFVKNLTFLCLRMSSQAKEWKEEIETIRSQYLNRNDPLEAILYSLLDPNAKTRLNIKEAYEQFIGAKNPFLVLE